MKHPVDLLPGIRAAVEAVAAHHPVVLITKGDLCHQQKKVAQSGLAGLFKRIEIVSQKHTGTYRRLLGEFALAPAQFAAFGQRAGAAARRLGRALALPRDLGA